MSKADELFNEIGFIKYEDNNNIKYSKEKHDILFHKQRKEIESCYGICSEFINTLELQAINEKVKELQWI